MAIDRFLLAGPVHFPVQVRYGGGSMDELTGILWASAPSRIALVTDPALPGAHAARVLRLLGDAAPTGILWPGPGGDGGGRPRVRPGTVVVALGGSRVMAAADRILCRDGARPAVVRLPTTLRAMADTALSVAGTSGRPAAPVLVRVQLEFLRTLPARAVRAGLSVPVRQVLAVVPASAGQVAFRMRPDGRYDPVVLASLIALCVQARSALVCHDPLERGPGSALRYGDTVARAVRGPGVERMRYGDALALGLRVTARAARLEGLLSPADEAAHADLLDRAGAARTLPEGVLAQDVLGALTRGRESVDMVLLRRLGEPHAHRGRLLTPVGADVLAAALAAVTPSTAEVLAPRDKIVFPSRGRRTSVEPVG
ncbi:hypothetical protein ACGFYU_00520 [Streptomyces sp. NPDC048337]|uniref:3-dehydroquinate synthase family protein n=1 Tax=Streptomyces sp. NPDC048337 TaxID=3365535 RepID=UPI003716FEDA